MEWAGNEKEKTKRKNEGAFAAFGILYEEEEEKDFYLWKGLKRTILFLGDLPQTVWKYYVPPMGGKVILLGLDFTVIIPLLELRYPRLSSKKKMLIINDLQDLEDYKIKER